jgi:hypothetical protein
VRSNILNEQKDAEVAVYAVWMPMLAGEKRSDWDGGPLVEPRVEHYWDEDRVLGRWLADHETGDLGRRGDVVWDAYFLYGPDASWDEELPEPLAAGAPIIAETGDLDEAAETVLASASK